MAHRRFLVFANLFLIILGASSCSSLPEPKHSKFSFPEHSVYMNLPTGDDASRPYDVMGWVKARAVYPTMDQQENNTGLCKNYFNKAARNLWREAKKVKADAVIQVRSVVLLLDGKMEEHETAECSDDGAQGEVLVRGIAIRFRPLPSPSPSAAK